jgi:hypothetical protein
MKLPENKHLLCVLVKAYNCSITDYFYFPEVIYAGDQKLDRADFEALVSDRLITLTKYDSFGRYYQLSKKGERLLQQQLSRPVKRKPAVVPLTQGCLYFNRVRNIPANTARCLLFL